MSKSGGIGITANVKYRNIDTGQVIESVTRTGQWLRCQELVRDWVERGEVSKQLMGKYMDFTWAYLEARVLGLKGASQKQAVTKDDVIGFLDIWDVGFYDEEDGEEGSPLA